MEEVLVRFWKNRKWLGPSGSKSTGIEFSDSKSKKNKKKKSKKISQKAFENYLLTEIF